MVYLLICLCLWFLTVFRVQVFLSLSVGLLVWWVLKNVYIHVTPSWWVNITLPVLQKVFSCPFAVNHPSLVPENCRLVVNFASSRTMYKGNNTVCILSRLPSFPSSVSVSPPCCTVQFVRFLLMSSIILNEYTNVCLLIYLLVDIWVASNFLLWIKLL